MNLRDIRSNEDLKNAIIEGYNPEYLFFWGHSVPRTGLTETCFSQWYPSQFNIKTLSFPTAEHYMMASKAALHDDEGTITKILKAKHPSDAKRLGRRIKNFDDPAWKAARMKVVVTGDYEKFSQNPELANFLLASGDKILVEASPVDNIWGIGMSKGSSGIEDPRNWKGLNLLGYALMQVRFKLIDNSLLKEYVPDEPKQPPANFKKKSKVGP